MKGIIYKATDNWDGRVYIGQTIVGLKRRRREHEEDAKRPGDNSAFHFALSLRNYDFKWEVIDTFEGDADFVRHALNVAEEYHILKHRSAEEEYGYNSTYGGYSSDKFAKHYKVRQTDFGGAKAYWQYDLEGNFLREFRSLNEIASEYDRPKLVASDLKEGVGQWHGYQWRRKVGNKPSPKIAKYEKAIRGVVSIAMYGSDGKLIKTFKKRIDAEREYGRGFTVRDDFSARVALPYRLRESYLFYRIPTGCECPNMIDVTILPAPVEKEKSPIVQQKYDVYDPGGNFIARYDSQKEAIIETGSSGSTIRKACWREEPIQVTHSTKYLWRYGNGEPRPTIDIIPYVPSVKPELQERRILQYSLEGDYIATHKNMSIASEVSQVPYSKIRNSCNGKKMYKSEYQWRYYTENFEEKIPPFVPRSYKTPNYKKGKIGRPRKITSSAGQSTLF